MNLLKSRTFITCALAALAKAAMLLVGKYGSPDLADTLKQLGDIAAPVVLFMVAYFTVNDFTPPVVQRTISRELTTRGLHVQTPTYRASAWDDKERIVPVRVLGKFPDDIQRPEVGDDK